MSFDLFGPLRSGFDLEEAVVDTLKVWAPTYLRELERQYEIDTDKIMNPRNIEVISDFEKWPEQTPPFIGVVSPGLIPNSPTKEGDGAFRAKWGVIVAAVVSSKDKRTTRFMAELYAAMIRGVMLQRRDLGGVAAGLTWIDEDYNDLPVRKSRTLAAATVAFEVELPDVVSWQHGPHQPVPPGDEGFPYTVGDREQIIIEINKEEIA